MKYTNFSKGNLLIIDIEGFPINLPVQLLFNAGEIRFKPPKGVNLDQTRICKLQIRKENHELLLFRTITLEGEIKRIKNSEQFQFIVENEDEEVIDSQNNLISQLISTLPEGKQPIKEFNRSILNEILNQKNQGLLVISIANNTHVHRVSCTPNSTNINFEIETGTKLSSILQYATEGTLVFDQKESSFSEISINGVITLTKRINKKEVYNFVPRSMTYGNQTNMESMQITSFTKYSYPTLLRSLSVKTKYWYNLLRLPLLLFSLIPLFVGSVLADPHSRNFEINLLILEIITLIFFQSAANLLNDYFDHKSDSDDYAVIHTKLNAGSRFLQLGLINQDQVKNYSLLSLILGGFIGLYINSLIGGIDILIIGTIGASIILLYSLPPFKLSYRWFGDILFAFTIFPLILIGSSFVQVENYSNLIEIIVIGASMASFVTAILFVGNIMSYDAEKAALKTTFTVKFGKQLTLSIIVLLLSIHYLVELSVFVLKSEFLLIIPILGSAIISIYSLNLMRDNVENIAVLEKSYRSLVYAFLLNYIPLIILLYY
ncbi:MAG: 1,4-dihydroxy-2-naphthoate octaprenyltransferase [Candidatus Heimdallarchaeota archaeon LC_2]|nr:MAG: 1,4-dihydroxy-2-naphthoate octaprenyltransferase [Candidatus Heimdallarchaeota archaeon LC_2]